MPKRLTERAFPMLAAAVIALFILLGRWSPSRLTGVAIDEVPFYLELRLWVVLALGVLALSSVSKSGAIPIRPPLAPMIASVALFVVLLLSPVWAVYPEAAISKAYDVFLIGCACVAVYLLATRYDLKREVWISIFLLGGALAAVGLVSALMSVMSGNVGTAMNRLRVFGGGPIVYGRLVGLVLLIALFVSLTNRSFRTRMIPIVVICSFLVVLTGSRGALFSVVVGAAVLLLRFRLPLRTAIAAGTGAIVTGFLLLRFTPLGSVVASFFQRRIVELTFEQRYVTKRDEIFLDAVELWLDRPWFGWGLDGFAASGKSGLYPHNLGLELLVEGGMLAGGLGLLVFLVYGWQLHRSSNIDWLAVAALCMFLLGAQVSGDIYDNRAVFIFIILSLSSAVARQKTQRLPNIRLEDSGGRVGARSVAIAGET